MRSCNEKMFILTVTLLWCCWCVQIAGQLFDCSDLRQVYQGALYECEEDPGQCIFTFEMCDGREDCPSGSDERCEPEDCRHNQIFCPEGICAGRCNGYVVCEDGFDETNCGAENCTSEQHFCPEGFCKGKCDGRPGCSDGSDEENCGAENCTSEQHFCPEGFCKGKCDGRPGCSDGSDEENCAQVECPTGRLSCPNYNSICIPKKLLCDGRPDCPDASDENNCRAENCTSEQHFCPEGSCKGKCDGWPDCSDGSDEENCAQVECPTGSLSCPNYNSICIPKKLLCDGRPDCPDASDENNCPQVECPTGWLSCPNYNSICRPKKELCDGEPDCPDASDENNCPPANCSDDKSPCRNHQSICISAYHLCDGKANCPDASDETNCPTAQCRDDHFVCPYHQSICKPVTAQCDRKVDCPDGADENNCGPENCTADQFYCQKGFCRPKMIRCDGDNDCLDWSDEENCRPENCTADQFYCQKGFCRPKMKRCDGDNDCLDWSDEENCPLRKCIGSEFGCLNGRCITHGFICDHFNDCGDWSDERNCSGLMSCGIYKTCPDGWCISNIYQCNGVNDCGDWSDEDRCAGGYVGCDPGWSYHRGRCFKKIMSEIDITWQEAQRHCHDMNSTLVSATSPSDEEFLVNRLLRNATTIYIGLQKDYKNAVGTFQSKFLWDDGSSITYENWTTKEPNGGELEHCTVMAGVDGWKDIFCAHPETRVFVCSRHQFRNRFVTRLPIKESSLVPHNWLESCNSGELTSKFKFCDENKDCRDGSDEEKCDVSCKDSQFLCENRLCISLSFYCDGINDCGDNSDEKKCKMKPCSEDEWTCANGQCIEESQRCDMLFDCYDKTDEADCGEICRGFSCYEGKCIPHSWVNDGVVDCDGYEREDESVADAVSGKNAVCLYGADEYGKVSFRLPIGEENCASFTCPDMYYKCQVSYCIPVMFVCDGKRDCPNGDDEVYCNRYVCHRRYRCQEQTFCIDPRQVCDGLRHCPMGDDERYCPQPCPDSCECDGRVIKCHQVPIPQSDLRLSWSDKNSTLQTTIPSDVRKLNLSGVDTQNASLDLSEFHYLAILDLSHCQLTTVEGLLTNNTNLIYLDLSNNAIQWVSRDSFSQLKELSHLDLSHNIHLTFETGAFTELTSLQYLDLGNTNLGDLNDKSFSGLSSLVQLNVTNSSIEKIEGKPFMNMELLRSIDLNHNFIEQFSCCFLKDLESLQTLFTYSYQFCCDSMRPGNLTPDNCNATLSDAISSCKDLLATGGLKAMLWIIVLFAMFGNIAVLVYRFRYDRASLKRSYGILVTNLSIADCLMGVYMLIIGIADAVYKDRYVSEDYQWRHGPVCEFAGFLSVLSSEASCIFISLITLDRFLAIKYPFGDVKLTRRVTVATLAITWMVAAFLAVVPLLPPLSHWELYSLNSVCLALPLSSERKPGWQYSTFIFIGLNFLLFLVIGIGQIIIFREVKAMPKIPGAGSNDAKVARRLFVVVMTDFCCWVPVGIMGIMVLHGIHFDKEVFSWTAVSVLPINSALNPIVYTLPSMIETWIKSSRENNLDRIAKSAVKETPLPNHPAVRNARRSVGKRSANMDTLGEVMRSPEMSDNVKCELISLIVIFINDLKRHERNFEAVTDENIYVGRCGEEITAVCLCMKPMEDRHWQVEDMVYLSRLLFENVQTRNRPDTGIKPKRIRRGTKIVQNKRKRRETRNHVSVEVPNVDNVFVMSELLCGGIQKKEKPDRDLQYKTPTVVTCRASKPDQSQRRGTF